MSEKLHDYVQKKFSKSKFYWDSDTVDYYADFKESSGWASTAMRIYEYVADECDWDSESDMRALYLDLLTQVEDKINKGEYALIENKLKL